MDLLLTLIIFATSLFATFISSMSGGGSSIITVPIYLALGIPLPETTLFNRFSSCFWVLPASRNYLKNKKVEWPLLLLYAVIGIAGAIIGGLFISKIAVSHFKPAIGVLILLLILWMFLRKDLGLQETNTAPTPLQKIIFYITAPLLGFYESIFGSGNGIIFANIAIRIRGIDLTHALGYYYFASFFWNVTAVIILFKYGITHIPLLVAATLGGIIGGHFGSRFGRYKGNKFIKIAFMIVGTILALKLIIGF